MTRTEKIENAIKYIREWLKDEDSLNAKDREVLYMAIKALKKELER